MHVPVGRQVHKRFRGLGLLRKARAFLAMGMRRLAAHTDPALPQTDHR